MKTKKFFTAAVLALGLFALSATAPLNPPTGGKPENPSAVIPPSGDEGALQCGVSNEQITAYLQGAPHYHTVYSVWDIPGTCNSNASIESCQIATVYVSGGRILGHVHSSGGICE
ncbi:MAG TPA: hypothetical protein VJ111_08925 [Chitinophagaceae bacterium]|nr:hypothetical protein [Chitinophagaceae bacterium]